MIFNAFLSQLWSTLLLLLVFHLMAVVNFALSVSINDLYVVKMYDLDRDLCNQPRSVIIRLIERTYYSSLYLMSVVTFTLSITIYEIFHICSRNVHDIYV